MRIYEGRVVYDLVKLGDEECLNSPENTVEYLKDAFNKYALQEQFMIVALDRKMRPIGRFTICIGLVDSVQVAAREVFRPAILAGASYIILSHNHPSGDPTPSRADLKVTQKLKEAGDLLDIPITDHVILGEPEGDSEQKGYYSFLEMGAL